MVEVVVRALQSVPFFFVSALRVLRALLLSVCLFFALFLAPLKFSECLALKEGVVWECKE